MPPSSLDPFSAASTHFKSNLSVDGLFFRFLARQRLFTYNILPLAWGVLPPLSVRGRGFRQPTPSLPKRHSAAKCFCTLGVLPHTTMSRNIINLVFDNKCTTSVETIGQSGTCYLPPECSSTHTLGRISEPSFSRDPWDTQPKWWL